MVFAATGVQQFLVMARHRWICHMICLWHLWHSPCVLRPPFGATAGSSRSMRVTRVHQTLCRFAHWQLRSGPLTSSRLGASHAVQCSSTNLTMSADVSWCQLMILSKESYCPIGFCHCSPGAAWSMSEVRPDWAPHGTLRFLELAAAGGL